MPVRNDNSASKRHARAKEGSHGRRRVFARETPEVTAPDSLIQRVGAENAEVYSSPLKAELTEDPSDTKD